MCPVTRPACRWFKAWSASVALVAAVTGTAKLLAGPTEVSGLSVLYLLAVLPVAVLWGVRFAIAVAILSTLAFDFVVLPPLYSLQLSDRQEGFSLVVFLVTAAVVSGLAARARRETQESARLGREQAALRRVATLVARGAPPAEVFDAVADELGPFLGADATGIARFETDGTATVVARLGWRTDELAVGTQVTLEKMDAIWSALSRGRSVRVDDYGPVPGHFAAVVRAEGLRSSVACPIVVQEGLWGAMIVGSRRGPLPAATELRMLGFTELLGIYAESRGQLMASRARVVAAADDARRRIERDLHDGAQQHLMALTYQLRTALMGVPPECGELGAELSDLADGLTGLQEELQRIARGIHPAILAEGGLEPALNVLARRAPMSIELDVRVKGRLPEPVELAAYYVVSEMLTNAAKHARASVVQVAVEVHDGRLHLSVHDDGVGGADPACGSGLVGVKDRVEALDGLTSVHSPLGAGTSVRVELPLERVL
jgi:signal transduction histidine kinase